MAHEVVRIVERCENANESLHLGGFFIFISIYLLNCSLDLEINHVYQIADLSECQLMQVPDAVYHLMRNVIKKISPKFALKFSLITGKIQLLNYSTLTK